MYGRRILNLVCGASAALMLCTACDTALVRGVQDRGDGTATPHGVVQIALLQSESDVAETPANLDAVMKHLVEPRAEKGYDVLATAAGARGLTGFKEVAHANFATDDVDGGNSVTRQALVAQRMAKFQADLTTGLAATPASNASDPFGAAAAAASLFHQYHQDIPRLLVIIGDALATTPTGCVLTERDLSERYLDALLRTCSPTIPALHGVQVYLVGAGYSIDSTIPPATATGLERLMRRFFMRAGARMCLYGPMLVSNGECS